MGGWGGGSVLVTRRFPNFFGGETWLGVGSWPLCARCGVGLPGWVALWHCVCMGCTVLLCVYYMRLCGVASARQPKGPTSLLPPPASSARSTNWRTNCPPPPPPPPPLATTSSCFSKMASRELLLLFPARQGWAFNFTYFDLFWHT